MTAALFDEVPSKETKIIYLFFLRLYLLEIIIGSTECTDVIIKDITAVLVMSLINPETVVSSFSVVPSNILYRILQNGHYVLLTGSKYSPSRW